MRRGNIFWAIILILVGVLLLLGNLGVFEGLGVSVWNLIWPLVLIALGIWLITGVLRSPRPAEVKEVAIPLEGASLGLIEIKYGAGQLTLAGGAAADKLAEGTFGGGVQYTTQRSGDLLELKMRLPDQVAIPSAGWRHGALDWNVRLNGSIPMALRCETGASRSELNLADLQVSEIELSTGASRTDITLPAAGFTRATIKAGAARVVVRIPGGVAASIRAKTGVARVEVDETRFPASGDRYQSPDYAAAVNKADIHIEAGVGSISIL